MPLSDFVDANCLFFDTAVEHQLQHTEIHNAYVTLCEALLSLHLEAVQLPQSAFVQVCEAGLQSTDDSARRLVGEVLLLEDYALFHARMVQRNIELDAQVLSDCLALQTQQRHFDKQRRRQQSPEVASDDEALRMALQLSLVEEESARKEREREAADIEYAIQLSLALQAEELRRAQERHGEAQQQQKDKQQQQEQHEERIDAGRRSKEERVEEEKEMAPAHETESRRSPKIASRRVSNSLSASASASLAPLKNLRRAYEHNVQRVEAASEERAAAAAVSEEQQHPPTTAEQSAAQQQYLRQQRERLIAHNKEAGSQQLSAFNAHLAATERAVAKQQTQQAANKPATTAAADARRAAMEAVLKARLRAEAEKTIASRTEQRSLDEQLHMLESLST